MKELIARTMASFLQCRSFFFLFNVIEFNFRTYNDNLSRYIIKYYSIQLQILFVRDMIYDMIFAKKNCYPSVSTFIQTLTILITINSTRKLG